jgi:hypothetical protein
MIRTTAILFVSLATVEGFSISPFDNQQVNAFVNLLPTNVASILPTDPSIPNVPEECFIDYAAPDGISDACNTFLEETDLIEQTVTTGISHAFLDFGQIWSENALIVQALTVFARVVVFLHIINHGHWQDMLPDEFLFQIGFLGFSFHTLLETANIKLEAQRATRANFFMTGKDRLAYRSLFRPAGFSWQQFREIDTQCMSWVSLEPGQVILDEADNNSEDNAVFWLYQGEAQIKSDDKVVHTLTCEYNKSNVGLIGERKLASLQNMGMDQVLYPKSYVAGEKGATLLRMDVPKLSKFLKYHDGMTSNFGRLAFDAMQNKLKAFKMQIN